MNKKALALQLSKEINLPIKKCNDVINSLQEIILQALKRGDEVRIQNFGCFKICERKARFLYNPNSKSMNHYSSKRVPKFTYSEKVKKIIKKI